MEEIVFNLQRFADDNSGLTDAEKKAARDSSLPHLRMISNVAKVPLFSAFVSMLEEKKTETEFLSSTVAPVYNLIGALYKRQYGKNGVLKLMEEAAIFTSTVKIIDSVLDICDNLADADAEALEDNILKIADESVKIGNKLKLENYNGIFSSVGSAALSYGLTVLASIDNLTPKAQTKIYKAFVKVGGATIKSVFKDVFETGEKFTAPFGLVDMGMSVLIGIVEGVSQMGIREEYYSDDGLPEDIAHKEALLDALSSGVHEAFHTYLKGADDIAFKVGQAFGEGCKWLAHAFSGDFSYEITISDMNYMEFVREIAKRGEYNSSSNADTINVPDSGVSIYAQDGDDYIENFYNNVTILAGHGNDTVSSYGGAKYNSILGGNDSDYLYIKNSSSTIEGGKDNDRFFITGDKNIIYGNDGDDQVSIKGSGNFFSGGTGDDLMLLDGAKNVVIEYTAGDGTDAIYGYDTSDLIKIKGEYSIFVSGNDKIIQIGKGGIIVKDAKDLTLNINTIDLEEGETLPEGSGEGFTPYTGGIVLAPRFQDNGEALRGTSTNDRIENTLSNIMIYSGDGNDTIINYGDNVTINAGNGNDHVLNYGDSVKINGGKDNDYIYSEGYKVTINAGDGKDTVDNKGNKSFIDGGADMDSIKNSGEDTNINSGGGKDRILNLASNVRAYGYLDENYITNTKSNVTLEGSDDNDYIFNSGNYVSIHAGEGNNSVSVDGSAGGSQTIEAGGGNDTVQVGERDETEAQRYYNEIYAGDGNNYINNSNVERSTISAGAGNDTIITGGGDSNYYPTSIVAGAGDNKITVNTSMSYGIIKAENGNDFVSIAGGGTSNIVYLKEGDDSVISGGSNSTINVGSGKNFVTLNANSSENKIIAGNGDDFVLINNSGDYNRISLGAGNNTLISTNGRETVKANDGDDKITVKSGDINVGGGANNISITYGGDTTITAGDGDDTINVADKAEEATDARYYNEIYAGDGNNFINNSNVEKSTISAGSGNDTIITGGDNRNGYSSYYTSIVAGAGNNRITVNSSMTYGEIYAGGGNDLVSISGGGSNNIVSVNSGDDSVIADIASSTINVGAGKNLVSLSNDGNDIIAGDGNNTLISTSGHEDVTMGNGNNKISIVDGYISVGNGNNELSVTANSAIRIFTGSGNDTINVADKAEEATEARQYNKIYAGDGNNFINNSNVEKSTISAGSGNDTIITGGDDRNGGSSSYYTSIVAGAGNNRITVNSSMTYGEIYAGGGNDLISITGDGSHNIISVGDGRNTIFTDNYYDATYNHSNSIEAGTGSDLIRTSGNHNFINAGSGRNSITLKGGQYNTIVTGKGDDTITFGDDANNNRIIFGGGNDLVVNYHAGDTVEATGTLTRTTIGADVILSDGTSKMTLQGASDKKINTEILSSGSTVYKILVADKTVGDTVLPEGVPIDSEPLKWKLKGTTATYGKLITLKGIKSLSGVLLNGNVITLSKAALGTANVTVNDGYALVLSNDVSKPSTSESWSLNGTTASYNQTTSEGYTLANDGKSVVYSAKTTKASATIKGLKSGLKVSNGKISGISLKGNVVTLSKAVLGTNKITISDGYTLKLGSDVTKSSTSKAWSVSKTTATYKQTTTAGYTLADNAVTYSGKSVETLATIKGLKSGLKADNGKISGISLKGNVVTLSKAVLGTDKVTISDGYTLKLGSDVAKPSTTKAWSVSKTTATYQQTTTAGYTLADNAVTYSKKSVETLATIKGLKSGLKAGNGKISGISLSGNVVTLSKAVLGTDKVTINEGYTLKLGSDVTKSSTSKAWSVSKTTATLKQTTTAGYALVDNAVTYSKNSSKTLATVTGVKNLKGISASDKIITLKAKSLNNNVSIDGNGYEFNFAAGNYKGSAVSGTKKADIITSRGKNLSVDGGAGNDVINVFGTATSVTGGKGNDTITSGLGGNVFFYADGDGKDVIADFAEDDKIKITKGTAKVTTSGDDVIVTVGKGSIKLAGAAGQNISVINSKGKEKTYATTTPSYALAYWFDEDDNNFGADSQLESIVKKSSDTYPSGRLETSTNLTAENNIIAYSGKK